VEIFLWGYPPTHHFRTFPPAHPFLFSVATLPFPPLRGCLSSETTSFLFLVRIGRVSLFQEASSGLLPGAAFLFQSLFWLIPVSPRFFCFASPPPGLPKYFHPPFFGDPCPSGGCWALGFLRSRDILSTSFRGNPLPAQEILSKGPFLVSDLFCPFGDFRRFPQAFLGRISRSSSGPTFPSLRGGARQSTCSILPSFPTEKAHPFRYCPHLTAVISRDGGCQDSPSVSPLLSGRSPPIIGDGLLP